MDIIQTVLAAIVTLGILVTIHEYGHFWVARRCGVKVLRFSIGFGRALYRWYDRQGTEYVIAAIPLGGYVKMLDEREGEVPDSLLGQAFNRKPVGQRIAIVAAGPLVNLAFAVIAYWFMFLSGISTVVPVIGGVDAQSPAAIAGLPVNQEIVAIDGHLTRSWEEVSLRLASHIGEDGDIRIRTQALESTMQREFSVSIQNWEFAESKGPLGNLGIQPFRPVYPAVIGQLVAEGRAISAGLKVGDLVLSMDGESVEDWADLVGKIQQHPEQDVVLKIERSGQQVNIELRPAERFADNGQSYGYIGAGVARLDWPKSMLREISYSPISAVPAAFNKSVQMVELTLESIWKMLQGTMSVKNLSGPITIAKVAGASAESGLSSYLNFLAYLSISLGVLNFLPIPMLDGGHLLYYAVEVLRGRPVSEKVQILGLKIGMALLITLMILAFYNDLARL